MKNRNIGIAWITAGFLFMVNPNIHRIDIFPDIIGLLMILYGMRIIANLGTHLSEARAGFTKVMWVELGKAAAMLLVFSSESLDAYMMFIFAFAGGLLECVFFIPAIKNFFSGAEYLRMSLSDKSSEKLSSDACTLSVVFIIARNILAAVPVFTPNADNEYGDVVSGGKQVDTGALRVALTVLCTVLALIVGIVWICSIVKYLKELKSDTVFCEKAAERYESEILTDERLMTKRRVKSFYAVYPLAFLFLLCLKLNTYYIVPEFLFGAAVIAAMLCAGKFADKYKKKTIIFCCVQIVLSLITYIIQLYYSKNYGILLYPYRQKGFYTTFAFYMIFMAAAMVFVYLICRKARDVQLCMLERCVGWGDGLPGREETDAEIKKEIGKKIKTSFRLQIAYCVLSVLCTTVIPLDSVSDIFAIAWAIRSAMCAACIISIYSCSSAVTAEAEK